MASTHASRLRRPASWLWLEDLLRDVRHAGRRLRRSPGFAATVVLVLALGIGVNTSMFSVVYGMLLRPLPYPVSGSIVRIGRAPGGMAGEVMGSTLTNADLPLVRDEAQSFEQVAAYQPRETDWAGPDGVVSLPGAAVSPAMFPLLRARPHVGRLFTEDEARAGAERVALLSHRAWTLRFGSDPDVVGAPLVLDDTPHIVVGVLEEGFHFPDPDAELWTPLVVLPSVQPGQPGQDPSGPFTTTLTFYTTLGRLRAGVSAERAEAELRTIFERRETPLARQARGDRPIGVRVVSLREVMVGRYRPALLAFGLATTLLLLIACANVAGLLLARGVARRRSLAVSAALGAGRGRLLRELLTESVVLSLAGGAFGLGAAALVLRAAPALVPGDVARLDEVSIDGAVLAFSFALSALVGLAFGAAPALQWSRTELVRALNEGGAQSTGGFRLLRSNRMRALLATAQVALALVLLVGAGLLLRSFVGLITADRGYDPSNVITAGADNPDAPMVRSTPWAQDDRAAASRRFAQALLGEMERVERLPGVAAVGVSSHLPLPASLDVRVSISFAAPGRDRAPGEPMPTTGIRIVSPGYFQVMRLRLLEGRFLDSRDVAGSPLALVVNETFARTLFGSEMGVGRPFRFLGESWEIVGVVADIRQEGLPLPSSGAVVYVSTAQGAALPAFGSVGAYLSVRTDGDPAAVVPFLREIVAEAHPGATLVDVMTMDARLSSLVAQPRFYATVSGAFAALALLLAAFGVYGLLSYVVAQRRAEIGIRMALGARPGDVLRLVFRQGAALVGAGAVVGLLAAAASGRLLESFLLGVAARDLLTFVTVPLVLLAVALAACWIPARRATRVDPMQALRSE